MSNPPLVPIRQREAIVEAIARDRVVVLPGDGAYQLAVRLDRPAARLALSLLAPRFVDPAGPAGPAAGQVAGCPRLLVASLAQAKSLADEWSDEVQRLTLRMWPGPLALIVSLTREAEEDLGHQAVAEMVMPKSRSLRQVVEAQGPLLSVPLYGLDGQPLTRVSDAVARFMAEDVELVAEDASRRGLPPTVVDARLSPPVVRLTGALPDAYVDAVLMMSVRRRRWGRRGGGPRP
jgi:tRNA A37 threonylcarbamoyladenosine synthetase subunit TsaC/SUA5/YrdC